VSSFFVRLLARHTDDPWTLDGIIGGAGLGAQAAAPRPGFDELRPQQCRSCT
jgi:hypothetical protein